MERPATLGDKAIGLIYERLVTTPGLAGYVLAFAAGDLPKAEAMMPSRDDPANWKRFMQAKALLQNTEHQEVLRSLADHYTTTVLASREASDEAYSTADFSVPTQRHSVE